MRRLVFGIAIVGLITSAVLAATALAGSHGSTGASSSNVRGICTATTGLDVYFWPQGHPAVPALGFPPFAPPHVEFYRARDVSNATGYLAFAGPRDFNLATSCRAVADRPMTPVPNLGVTLDQQKIRCTFSGDVEIRIAPLVAVKTRVVRKVVFVRVKGKRVRRVIRRRVRTTTRIGTIAEASATGIPETLVRVGIRTTPPARPDANWNQRYCAPIALTD